MYSTPWLPEVEPIPKHALAISHHSATDRRKHPVMFYSHGGGFTVGSAAAAYQDGGNLAKAWDVVVVSTNDRLGLMGLWYLGELGGEEYGTSGNQELLDILRWSEVGA